MKKIIAITIVAENGNIAETTIDAYGRFADTFAELFDTVISVVSLQDCEEVADSVAEAVNDIIDGWEIGDIHVFGYDDDYIITVKAM